MKILYVMLSTISNFEYVVSIVGFGIVILSLSILVIIFTQIPKLLHLNIRKKMKREGKSISVKELSIEGNVNAAIAMALYLYMNENHDEESNVVTIKNVHKRYAPWSSKIYNVYDNWPKR